MKADDERDLARSCIGWQLTRPIDSAAGRSSRCCCLAWRGARAPRRRARLVAALIGAVEKGM
jgi:hypothetical protein